MAYQIGRKYIDCGYNDDVPKSVTAVEPDANVWRRVIIIRREPDTRSTLVPVTVEWQYMASAPNVEYGRRPQAAWVVATSRRLDVPATSLGGRFQPLDELDGNQP